MCKLACVDGLRGLAVLLVILFHLKAGMATLSGPGNAVRAALSPLRFGFTGVHLFLVLSGYCLTYSLLSRADAGGPVGQKSYFLARFRRIAPPYYAAMIVYLLVAAAIAGQPERVARLFGARQILSHALFLHGLWPDTIYAINTAFWTLSLEAQFYAALPILMALSSRRGAATTIAVVAASSLAFRLWLWSSRPDLVHLEGGLFLGRWTEFALGMWVAVWYRRSDRASWRVGLVASLGATAGLGLGAGLFAHEYRVPIAPDFCLGLGYAALLAAALASSERGGRLGRSLAAGGWVAMGTVSYSLYLTHSLVIGRGIQLYQRLVPAPTVATDAAMVAFVLPCVAALGLGFYRLIESRFVRSVDISPPAATRSVIPAHRSAKGARP